MIDRRPAIIAYCANVHDVIQSIAFARETGILTSVRSGGHNIAEQPSSNLIAIKISVRRQQQLESQRAAFASAAAGARPLPT